MKLPSDAVKTFLNLVSEHRSPAATKNGHEVIKSLNYVADASGFASSRRAYSTSQTR